MKCPKCGYISFDFYDTCPKCSKDLTEIRGRLILFPFKPSAINWLQTEEEIATPSTEQVVADVFTEEGTMEEEIELETVSLDSLDVDQEKKEEKALEIKEEKLEEKIEEEKEIEVEPVDLNSLEEKMAKKEKEKQETKKESKKDGLELETIDVASLEIELEEDKGKEKEK